MSNPYSIWTFLMVSVAILIFKRLAKYSVVVLRNITIEQEIWKYRFRKAFLYALRVR